MNASTFFAGAFLCAVAAICVIQCDFLKNEAVFVSVGLAVIGSILIKFGFDALSVLKNSNNEVVGKFAEMMVARLECVEKQLLQNNETNKNSISLLSSQFAEKQEMQLQTLTEQREVAGGILRTLQGYENTLISEHNQIITIFNDIKICLEERLQSNTIALGDIKTEIAKDIEKILGQATVYQKNNQEFLKRVKDITVYAQNISDKTGRIAELNENENWKKNINRHYQDFSDLKEEIENSFDDLKEVLAKLQEEMTKQNEANREQLNVFYGKYADITEKDIKLINKIYDGLKK